MRAITSCFIRARLRKRSTSVAFGTGFCSRTIPIGLRLLSPGNRRVSVSVRRAVSTSTRCPLTLAFAIDSPVA